MRATAALAAALLLGGCIVAPTPQFENLDFPLPGGLGRLYTHVIEPLDVNERATATSGEFSRGDVKRVTYSNVSVAWGANGVGELAKRAGFREVLYADVEVWSILGIWTQTWVHVYGR